MDSRDRDRERNARNEKALERILPGALAEDAAAVNAAACPDAEILAAFYERSLAPAEATHWRAHFATCRRCQLSLAALAASDPSPLAEKEVERLGELVADATAPRAAGESPLRAKPPKIKWPWFLDPRALAPMAAAAAFVAAVGLTIHTHRSAMQLQSQNGISQQTAIVAENRLAPAPPALQMPASPEVSRAAAPAEPGMPSRSRAAVAAPTDRDHLPDTGALMKLSPPVAAAPPPAAAQAAPPPAPAPEEATDRATAENGAAPGGNSEAAGGAAAPPPESVPAEAPSASANAPASGTPAPTAPASAPAEVHAASSHVRREEGVFYNKNAEAPAAVTETVTVTGATGYFTATAPDGQTGWRFGLHGLIERITNANAAAADQKWTREKSPLHVDLLAGSAPSGTVCWIVGRAGAILRTTDGAKWQVIPSPASAARDGVSPDWVAVSARDANSATITSADNRTFTTTNAGHTWQLQ